MKGNDRSGDGKLTADGAERPTYVTVTWRRTEEETGQTLGIFWDDLQFDWSGGPDGAQGDVTGRPHLYLLYFYDSVAVVLRCKAKYFKGGRGRGRQNWIHSNCTRCFSPEAAENEPNSRLKLFNPPHRLLVGRSRTPADSFDSFYVFQN